jgi:hypothetical protein
MILKVCRCGALYQPFAGSKGRCRSCAQAREQTHSLKNTLEGKNSAEWRRIRRAQIEAHPFCAECCATDDLTVHRPGGGYHHDDGQYIVLCRRCHGSLHGKRVQHR